MLKDIKKIENFYKIFVKTHKNTKYAPLIRIFYG